MKLKCLVIDDEPLARRILERYIDAMPSLELSQACSNALEASAFLLEHDIDVMFLDIKMPELTGVDFLKTLNHPPQVIITTAYSEYALEGYEYSVVDYLLKPIAFERFVKAVNKLKPPENKTPKTTREQKPKDNFIFVKTDQAHLKIKYQEIDYLQGYGNYVKIFTVDRKILISDTLTRLERILPGELFTRIHKSYIVSITKIERITDNRVTIKDTVIPIGRMYKSKVNDIIKKFELPQKTK